MRHLRESAASMLESYLAGLDGLSEYHFIIKSLNCSFLRLQVCNAVEHSRCCVGRILIILT